MKGKSPDQNQKNIFMPLLKDFLNMNHPLVILAERFPWDDFEEEFSGLYSHKGTPGKPIRLMVGLLVLKQMFNLGDETLMPQWVQNPYFQYFCGEAEFQWKFPCDPSDLVHFRKRIGRAGVEKIFSVSVSMQDKRSLCSKTVIVDTTVQEKNITFPTDSKLYVKVIAKCNTIANDENIRMRQSYKRTVKNLQIRLRFSHHPRRIKEARKALRKLRTLAGRQVRDLERKMNAELLEKYSREIDLFKKVIAQRRHDSNKIYSLHEPEVSCIAKGKSHKEYEFGSKVSFATLPGSNIVVGVVNFQGNPHDSKTLMPTLETCERITGRTFDYAVVDRGYRGQRQIGDTQVIVPGQYKARAQSQKQWYRKKCRSRSAIEPVIGHIKYDCRMIRNYLKGTEGDIFNAFMAAAAFNFRKLLRKIEQEIIFIVFKTTDSFAVFKNDRFVGLEI
jgi:IS5 family transposase